MGLFVNGLRAVQGGYKESPAELKSRTTAMKDSTVIAKRYGMSRTGLQTNVETVPNGVIDHDIMALVDRFGWHMRNIEGVQSTMSLADLAKTINAGWNEGSLKWRIIPRNPADRDSVRRPYGLRTASSVSLPCPRS